MKQQDPGARTGAPAEQTESPAAEQQNSAPTPTNGLAPAAPNPAAVAAAQRDFLEYFCKLIAQEWARMNHK